MNPLVITVKEQKDHDSFMELARTRDGYLFDEVSIKKINHTPRGVEFVFEYTRFGRTERELAPMEVNAQEFAATRAATKTQADFAKTDVVNRLFASGARQFNERSKPNQANFAADLEFLNALASDTLPKE